MQKKSDLDSHIKCLSDDNLEDLSSLELIRLNVWKDSLAVPFFYDFQHRGYV